MTHNYMTETIFRREFGNALHHLHINQSEFVDLCAKLSVYQSVSSLLSFSINLYWQGYVYDLSTPKLLSQFEFTGECIASEVNTLFLFALTPAGMEVWSVLGSTGGCLLRFHPFIGLKSISVADNHVTLLSKFSSNENVSIAAYYNKRTSNLCRYRSAAAAAAVFPGANAIAHPQYWPTQLFYRILETLVS